MITRQNMIPLFVVIIIAITLSISTPVYAGKKLKTAHTVAKLLHNGAAAVGGGASAVFAAYQLCEDSDSVNEKVLYCVMIYLGSTLVYKPFYGLVDAIPDIEPIVDSKKTVHVS